VDSSACGLFLEKCAGPGAHGAGAELFGEVAVPGWFLGRHQLCGGVAGPTSGERVVALHLANPFGSLARQDAIPRLLCENNIAVAVLGDGARYQDWTSERVIRFCSRRRESDSVLGTIFGPHVVRDAERPARLCTSRSAADHAQTARDLRKCFTAIYWGSSGFRTFASTWVRKSEVPDQPTSER
jgi:hypothetical protein